MNILTLLKKIKEYITKFNCPTCNIRTVFLYKLKTLKLHDVRGCPKCKNKFVF